MRATFQRNPEPRQPGERTAPTRLARVRRSWNRLPNWLAVTLALLLAPLPARLPAADAPRLEYPVKAAFVYNFAKFVAWPTAKFPQKDSPLVIGIVGADPFEGILDDLVESEMDRKGKRIDGRRLVVRHLAPDNDLKQCHILFISRSLQESLGQILAGLGSESVLTVSEIDGFSARGGMLSLTVQKDTLKSELNLDAAERAGVKVSSRLSSVVRFVHGEKPRPD
jgi:hypothetical protein